VAVAEQVESLVLLDSLLAEVVVELDLLPASTQEERQVVSGASVDSAMDLAEQVLEEECCHKPASQDKALVQAPSAEESLDHTSVVYLIRIVVVASELDSEELHNQRLSSTTQSREKRILPGGGVAIMLKSSFLEAIARSPSKGSTGLLGVEVATCKAKGS
jgi:hypothetical protein